MSKNRICAVVGCNNINYYIYKNPDGVQKRFFHFPRARSMCVKWIERLNRLDLYPVLEEKGSFELWKNYRVCSDHFVEADLTKAQLGVKGARRHSAWLLRTAVPSQNLGDENEIYVAGASALQLLEEVEENVQIKAEPLPQLPQEEDPAPFGELRPKTAKKTSKIIKHLRVPSQNLGDQNEIYIAGASVLQLFEEVEENVQPLPQLPREEDPAPLGELRPKSAKKTKKTASEIIKHLREKLALTEELVEKYRLETKLTNERFEEFDRFKNRYINYHSVDGCKGKDSCSCQRDFALDLYMKSPQVYKHLQKKFLLPHTSVLYRWKLQKDQETLQRKLELSAEP